MEKIMKIQDLIYYRYLADCSSFTKTAEAFYVSQPSISIALKRLEEEFDSKLITRDRSTKSFALTPTGKILYERANQIIDILDQTKNEMKTIESNEVSFGFLPTIGGYFLPQIMPNLAKYVPSINLIEDESSSYMLQLLEEGRVSAAIIGLESFDLDENWAEIYPLDSRPLSVCVSKTHPLAEKDVITLDMLNEYSLITLDDKYVHYPIFKKWMDENKISSSKVTFAKEIQSVNSLISQSVAVGIVFDVLVRDRFDIITIPLEGGPEFNTALVFNKNLSLSKVQEEFNQSLRKAVKNKK